MKSFEIKRDPVSQVLIVICGCGHAATEHVEDNYSIFTGGCTGWFEGPPPSHCRCELTEAQIYLKLLSAFAPGSGLVHFP